MSGQVPIRLPTRAGLGPCHYRRCVRQRDFDFDVSIPQAVGERRRHQRDDGLHPEPERRDIGEVEEDGERAEANTRLRRSASIAFRTASPTVSLPP